MTVGLSVGLVVGEVVGDGVESDDGEGVGELVVGEVEGIAVVGSAVGSTDGL